MCGELRQVSMSYSPFYNFKSCASAISPHRQPFAHHFINVPDVLDYLPVQRVFMSGFILAFCSVQISLVLHNETLREAFRTHRQLIRRDFRRLAWFCLICALNFSVILVIDAIMRSAIADRTVVMMIWKSIFVFLRALVTGWLLASWVVLFRQCETGRIAQENWIRY